MKTTLIAEDGLALHLRHWPAPFADAAVGTVLIVHGLGEHIGRYEHVAAQLNAWGWHVVGHDQRGHGASAGGRGRLARADDLLRDLGQVIDEVRAAHTGPLVLLGHSMGGLVAARFVATGTLPDALRIPWYREVEGLVLSSPALDIGMHLGQRLLLAMLGSLAPDLAVANGLRPAWISRDAAVVDAYVADPLVHDRVSPRLVRFMLDGAESVRACASQWKVPTLLLYGGGDRCVRPSGSADFAGAAPPSVVTAHEFASLYHEVFNEPEQARVFAAMRAWLAKVSVQL